VQNTARHSVVIARPGHATIAAGPYRSPAFADLVAHELGHALADQYPIVDVAPYEEELLHLPGGINTLVRLIAALDGQPSVTGTTALLAGAYTRHAEHLRNALDAIAGTP
jgi:hypothetical protein